MIFLDGIGNPVSDGTWSYDWHHGRQLERMFGEGPDGYVEVEYAYDANGMRTEKTVTNMVFEDVGTKTGLYLCSDGEIRYFTDGEPTYAGLVQDDNGDYYYINSSLTAVRGRTYWVTKTNDILQEANYVFGADGRMVVDEAYGENGTLYTGMRLDVDGSRRYYVNGIPTYAGLVYIDGYYYYFNGNKVALRSGTYSISKTNGLLPEGTYTFDSQCRMVDPPEAAAVYSTTSYQVLVPAETTTYRYTYNGGSLTQMTVGSDTLYFAYAGGTPMSVTYNNATYYYVTNLQGDVVAILNIEGEAVVQYTYNAWGNILTTSGTMASTLGEVNPLTYRSYVYDHETGLYYLQSRYYDPELSRFINADAFPTTGQGIIGNNMFAYCGNNPITRNDQGGTFWHLVVGTAGGAIIGALSSVISQTVSQLSDGKSLNEVTIDGTNVLIAAGAGAMTGLLAATGAGIVAQVAGNVAASAISNALTQANNISKGAQEGWSWSSFAFDVAAGAVSGIWGGRGASYGNSGGIMKSGFQFTKRVLNNIDEFGKAYVYYAKTAHQAGGSYVMSELGKALLKGFVVANANTGLQTLVG